VTDDTLDKARAGDTRALARLLSLVEDESPAVRSVIKDLLPATGGARIIGLTGSPGVGKSTLTSALVGAFRAAGRTVAVLAVDPTSPFSGGALLGDRIRMQEHAADQGVFIRSMASRGHLGGLAASTPQAIRVLDAAGFELIIIETVGVGQAEVAIASLADSVVVLLAPGMGDAIQAAKAGILEVADLFVVNKADKPDAQQVVRDLRNMIALADRTEGDWKPPIVSTVATKGAESEGIQELVSRLNQHWSWLSDTGELKHRRLARAREELTALAFAALRGRLAVCAVRPAQRRRLDKRPAIALSRPVRRRGLVGRRPAESNSNRQISDATRAHALARPRTRVLSQLSRFARCSATPTACISATGQQPRIVLATSAQCPICSSSSWPAGRICRTSSATLSARSSGTASSKSVPTCANPGAAETRLSHRQTGWIHRWLRCRGYHLH
jgi:LAO/AO transport system kinase